MDVGWSGGEGLARFVRTLANIPGDEGSPTKEMRVNVSSFDYGILCAGSVELGCTPEELLEQYIEQGVHNRQNIGFPDDWSVMKAGVAQ